MGFNSRIFTVTNAGFALFAKTQGGGTMQFTRYALGDGEIGNASASTLKALLSERASAAMEGKNVSGARVTLTTKLLMTSVTVPFYWRELGIFASDGSTEILYAYASTANPEYIDPAGGTTDKILSAQLEVGEAQITIVAPPSAMLVSRAELEAAEQSLQERMDELSGGLTQDMHNLELDLTQQMDQVEYDLRADMSELDERMTQGMDDLSGNMDQKLTAQTEDVDEKLADMDAKKATTATYTATIPATGWSGSAAPYSIATITVTGMLATDTPIVDIVQTGTEATDSVMRENWGKITRIVTKADGISVYASEIPSAAIPIQLKVVR